MEPFLGWHCECVCPLSLALGGVGSRRTVSVERMTTTIGASDASTHPSLPSPRPGGNCCQRLRSSEALPESKDASDGPVTGGTHGSPYGPSHLQVSQLEGTARSMRARASVAAGTLATVLALGRNLGSVQSSTAAVIEVSRHTATHRQNRVGPSRWLIQSPLVLVKTTEITSSSEVGCNTTTPEDPMGRDVSLEPHVPVEMAGAAQRKARPTPFSLVPKDRTQRRQTTFVMMLAALCGAMDAIFFQHYQCYANMMTGNTIKMATALANGEYRESLLCLSLIIMYMGGCSLWRVLSLQQETPSCKKTRLRRVIPTTLGLFMASDVLSNILHPKLFLPVLSMAFGLVNTATVDTIGVVTNAATGHVSKIGMGLVGLFLPGQVGAGKSCIPMENVGYLASFAGSIVLTTKLYQSWVGSSSCRRQILLPPLGMTLGSLYSSALWWYTRSLPIEHPSSL